MANLYRITPDNIPEDFNSNNSNYLLASRAYVDALVKKLSDLISDEKLKNIWESINTNELVNIEEIPTNKTESIDVESIVDSNHRFVTDSQLTIFKNKISKFELQSTITNFRAEIEKLINDAFIKLINEENAIQRIKDISYIISESADLDRIITLLASKATKEEIEEHSISQSHLTNNDRKALNLLIDFIKEGCADWNASPEDPNYIRNKPESLPANGGNADTLSGYKPDVLINHQAYEIIIGIGNPEDKVATQVDILLPMDNSENENLAKLLHNMKTSCSIMFRFGYYTFKILNLNKHSITGSPNGETLFNVQSMYIDSTTVRDINFIKSNIHIGSNANLENLSCINCNIYVDAANQSTIRNCTFIDCNFIFNGVCMYNIITENRFRNSGSPMYYGGNNLITNNLIY